MATGIGAGLLLQLKLCGVAAIVVSAPYWIYQIWAFILPGLHPQERKWSRVVACIAGPLFFLGVALGYYILPKGIQVLIDFVPTDVTSLVDFGAYFSFVTRMLLIFGIAMEIPFFVILLNLAGVVSGKTLGRYRPWIVIGVFVFAAVATPSTDPFSMLMLAIPLQILFIVAEIVARLVDRARGRGADSTDQWDDDELLPDLMSRQTGAARDLDPFDLPEWLGAEPVVWTPEGGIHDRHLVTGALGAGEAPPCPAPCWPSTRPTRSPSPTTTCGTWPTRRGSTARCSWSPSTTG